ILMTEGLGDNYTPNQVTEALAVAIQLNPVAPVLEAVDAFGVIGRQMLTPPVTGNLGSAPHPVTGVLAQYAAASDAATNPHHDGHYVAFWNVTAREEYGRFLGSLAASGAATFSTP